jgi:hypothetical protein
VESVIGPSASVQYLCVREEHIRLGLRVRDGQGHLTIRNALWAYCPAGRMDEPHEWEAVPARPFSQIRHSSIVRTSGRVGDGLHDAQDEDRG